MILPKKLLNQISYYEYTYSSGGYGEPVDIFTLHFKSWWKRKKVIKIVRRMTDIKFENERKTYSHYMNTESIELLNSLKEYAKSTYKEDVRDRYYSNDEDNIITLKPKE